ncbi:MAG TPA: carbohydrate-binding family 9-like protein [Gemmataceae bacterium]|nr:carbohydrate-binding family 9-like protein [Gemmataceae bacterium]
MFRRFLFLLPLLPLACSDPPPPAKPQAEPPVVRAAECRWATGPIKIDGRIDEPAWNNAQELTAFSIYWEKRVPSTVTTAKLLWDEQYFYFMADMEDYDLYADVTERNGMTWLNDVFEIFLKPSAGKPPYYEFQVNAANTPLELFLPSRGAGGYQRFARQSKLGLESAVKLRGTLNKFTDKDGGWTVEGRIPWSAFKQTGGRPEVGAKWKFALCRYDYSWTLEQPELMSTAPLTKPDFHRHEDWGELTFVK